MALAGELLVQMTLDGETYAREMRKIRNANENLERSFTRLSNLGGTVLTRGIQALTAAFAGLSYQMVTTGAKFEQTIQTLAAIKGVTKDNVGALEEQARLLGRTTAYTATEAAEGMQELARAGMSTNEILEVSGTALNFAGANAISMTQSTETLATTLAQFNLEASNSARVADTFTIAAQNSLFTVGQLAQSMKYAGTVGAAYGMSLEETTAALGEFRELGLKGFTAGTQFRQALISLAAPTKKAKDTLEKYGLTVDDVNVGLHGFQKVMQTIGKTNMDISDITALVSKRAAASVTTISQAMADAAETGVGTKYDELLEKFDKGAGTTANTYAQMIDTLQGKFAILKSVYQEALLSVFDIAGPKLMEFVDELTGALSMLYKIIQQNSGAIGSSIDNLLNAVRGLFGGVAEGQGDIYDRQAQMAATIAITIVKVTNLVAEFIKLIPILLKIGKILAYIFVGNLIRNFTAGVAGLIVELARLVPAFASAGAAAAGFQSALMGPIGALLSIGGAIAAFLVSSKTAQTSMSDTGRKSLDMARDMRQAAKEIAAANRNLDSAAESRIERNIQITKGDETYIASGKRIEKLDASRINQIKDYLKEQDKLSSALEGSLSQSASLLTAKTKDIKESFRQGKLVEKLILVNGKLEKTILSVDTARRLEATGLEAFNYASRDTAGFIKEQSDDIDKLRQVYSMVTMTVNNFNKTGVGGTKQSMTELSGILKNNEGILKKYGLTTVVNTTTQVENLVNTLRNMGDELVEVNNEQRRQILLTDAALKDEEKTRKSLAKQAELDAKAAKAEDAYEERKKRIKEYEKLLDSLAKKEKKLRREREIAIAESAQKNAISEKHYFEDLFQQYNEAIKMTGKSSKKRIALEDRYIKSVRMRRDILEAEDRKSFDERLKALNTYIEDVGISEAEAVQRSVTRAHIAAFQTQEIEENRAKQIRETLEAAEDLNNQTRIKNARGNKKKLEAEEARHTAEMERIGEEYQASITDIATRYGELRTAQTRKGDEELALMKSELIDESVKLATQATEAFIGGQSSIEYLQSVKKTAIESLQEVGATEEEVGEAIKRYNRIISQEKHRLLFEYTKEYGNQTEDIRSLEEKLSNALFGFQKKELSKRIQYLKQRAALEKELVDIANKFRGAEQSFIDRAQAKTKRKLAELEKTQISTSQRIFDSASKAILSYSKAYMKAFTPKAIVGFFQAIGEGITDGVYGLVDFGIAVAETFQSWEKFSGAVVKLFAIGSKGFIDLGILAFKFTKIITTSFIQLGALALNVGNQLASGFSNAVSFISGGVALDIRSVLQGGLDAIKSSRDELKSEREALQDQLDRGEISQADFDRSLTELQSSFSPQEVAKNYVSEMIQGGIDFAQSIIDSAPSILASFAQQLPSLLRKVSEAIPSLVQAVAENLPTIVDALIEGFISSLTSLSEALIQQLPGLVQNLIAVLRSNLPNLVGVITEVALGLIDAIIELLPTLLNAFISLVPKLVTAFGQIITKLAEQLPSIIDALLLALPSVITALLNAIPSIISALVAAIPQIIKSITKALPQIVDALVDGSIAIIQGIIDALPVLIDGIIEALPALINAIINAIPQIIMAVSKAIPDIIMGIIRLIPSIFTAIVQSFPMIITMLIKAIPQIAIALVSGIYEAFFARFDEVLDALGKGIGDAFVQAGEALGQLFKDIGLELLGLLPGFDNPETQTFGDTPHPIHVGPKGMTARFERDDYVIAAKNPMELVRQAYQAQNQGGDGTPPRPTPPSMSGSQPIDIAIMAEGRLLDAVQVTALNRGHAPKLRQVLRKTSGVTVGFNRGRFNKFTA